MTTSWTAPTSFTRSLMVVGAGGREHAIAWKLAQSPLLAAAQTTTTIYMAPGNACTASPAPVSHVRFEAVPFGVDKIAELVRFAQSHDVGLVVVGPEDPLGMGMVDAFRAAGITAFGPSAAAARLECSKAFCKEFMHRHNIPTASYHTFTALAPLQTHLKSLPPTQRLVVKASGLAAGKGVIMCNNVAEAEQACHELMVEKKFGTAGETIVLEEWLDGVEASVLAFCDGQTAVCMPVAQDHKRVWEFDRGLNTGGMGAFAPASTISPSLMSEVSRTVMQACVDGCRKDGHPFVGILFAGLMITSNGPRVLEYNVRFGDPETEVVLPLLDSDLLTIFLACIAGALSPALVQWKPNTFAATIVAASQGYPEAYAKNKTIRGLERVQYSEHDNPVTVFHAGTVFHADSKTVATNGGRVLTVTALGSSLAQALDRAYTNLDHIHFDGMFYRRDIGQVYHRPHAHRTPLRLGVLGSTNGTDLKAILDAIAQRTLNATVECVISNRSKAGILDKARAHNIPFYVPTAPAGKSDKDRETFDRECVKYLQQHNVDLVLLIGYMRIVSPFMIDAYMNRLLNVHPSLLPLFAGGMNLDVHAAVLASGAKETGCTVHLIDNGPVDGGPILVQKRCTIDANETSESLKTKVQALEGEAFIEAIQLYNDDQHMLTSLARGEKPARCGLYRLFRRPAFSAVQVKQLVDKANQTFAKHNKSVRVTDIDTEFSFYIDFERGVNYTSLGVDARRTLKWLLAETFESEQLAESSFLVPSSSSSSSSEIVEVGPRMSFTSAWSTNACSVCQNSNVRVQRLERFRRYQINTTQALSDDERALFANLVHDRMTEFCLVAPLESFSTGVAPEPWTTVPLLAQGKSALEKVNVDMGLALDAWDLDFIYELFTVKLKRDPTTVELFDISQSNSEHSRHWFFRGQLVLDGQPAPDSLMKVVKATLDAHPTNSVIAFSDNSSAIRGFDVDLLLPSAPADTSRLGIQRRLRHLLLTAETHNFPSGVAPFPGAETGTGGRIRDTHATGSGSYVCAGTAAYCVGNLNIPDYPLPWEDKSFTYPSNLATPLQIEVQASNGASDYGNKFGEPVVAGFTRSFGLRVGAERREYVKPIMFSAGIGFIDDEHCVKGKAEKGMVVVKLGGPAYRIGMGGSAASSMVQGENKESLDFNAVQRGDAEMGQKLNRVIRACVELGAANPIISIHDQGAGGNCNVLKEIVEPAGGRINIRDVLVGDSTMSVLELWGAEYQEADALLIRPHSRDLFARICARERTPFSFVGEVTGDGVVVVYDSRDNSTPVNLDLETVLGNIPQKTFTYERVSPALKPLELPTDISLAGALDRVLRLVSVGSKRFLTNKVDRSVTGLVARQQCVGPLQLPLANCAVLAQSHFATTGVASSVGEQPIKGLLSPQAMARLTVGEALTNLVWADLTAMDDIKCSANWMWAAKLKGEGAALYDACVAMRDVMIALGVAVDGGKDSLSMAARAPDGETVKAPGTLVVSLYCACPDITKTVTPDLKRPGQSTLVHVDMSGRAAGVAPRLGGSSLAHVYQQLGDQTPDLADTDLFKRAFGAIQQLLKARKILAGHDVSDGGLLVTLLEMAFAGNCGISVDVAGVDAGATSIPAWVSHLFGEELGVVLEVSNELLSEVLSVFTAARVPAVVVGTTTFDPAIRIAVNGASLLADTTPHLRDVWEATSFQLELLQADPECVRSEQRTLAARCTPPYKLTFPVQDTPASVLAVPATSKPKIAVVREEGSNGDREMAAALYAAGFDVWDVTMTDLLTHRVSLNTGSTTDGRPFRGVAFVGGFSYGDVLDSAKGWAGAILRNPELWQQFQSFYARPDTFSLGVCNGCQLMALMGWVPFSSLDESLVDHENPPARFIHNASGRYESRWTTVTIQPSPAIMLQGMEGSTLGVYISHGEGRAYFPQGTETLARVKAARCIPMQYVDDAGAVTDVYPFNANGSIEGIAGLCSPDGRHLAMMPHPERVHRSWAWPYLPSSEYSSPQHASPWIKMFQNAYEWCMRVPGVKLYGANEEKERYCRLIRANMSLALNQTSLTGCGERFVGKVRDTYVHKSGPKAEAKDASIVLVTTDRMSAFDRTLACVPLKGQVLNLVSRWWFEQTKDIVRNHVLSVPHPNVTVGKACKPFPIEFVCRAYITGSTGTSLWTHYAKGVRNYCGNAIPDGMVKNQRLARPIITPTTKSDEHDRPISPAEIVSEGWMTQADWDEASAYALAVFERGIELAREHGLLLVDTKYEMGKDADGKIVLIDEVHTPDSSRYWIASSYETLFAQGKEPENIDKEFLRLWYIQHCDPYKDAVMPEAPVDLVVELSRRYILLYEMITGQRFPFPEGEEVATNEAIQRKVGAALGL